MELKTSAHGSDYLYLTHHDIDKLCLGETLRVGALEIKIKKPDVVLTRRLLLSVPPCTAHPEGLFDLGVDGTHNIAITLDGETLRVKKMEVL